MLLPFTATKPMPALYLKDRLSRAPGRKLTLTIVNRSPGIISKKKKDGSYYQVYEFQFRTQTGEEFVESIWPQTTTGKPNPLLSILQSTPLGQSVDAFLNERGFMDFAPGGATNEYNQDPSGFPPSPQELASHQKAFDQMQSQPLAPGAPLPPWPPPYVATEKDFILALHGVVQAQLSGDLGWWHIRGEPEPTVEALRKPPSAEDWLKWIGDKAKAMYAQSIIK